MSFDYKSIIDIDRGNLDTEWEHQASRYMEVIEAQVDASENLNLLKDKLAVQEAVIAGAIRQNPEMYGITKITDQVVKETVAASEKIAALQAEISSARRQQALLNGVVTAMEHRKKALENLVELHIRNYQATPRPKSEIGKEAGERLSQQFTHDKIGNSFTRRTRT